jgi:hypothetical protein
MVEEGPVRIAEHIKERLPRDAQTILHVRNEAVNDVGVVIRRELD